MTKLQEVEQAIQRFSPEELTAFRAWFAALGTDHGASPGIETAASRIETLQSG